MAWNHVRRCFVQRRIRFIEMQFGHIEKGVLTEKIVVIFSSIYVTFHRSGCKSLTILKDYE